MEKVLNYGRGKRLRLFAGPNGSGKSTIFRQIDLGFDIGYYVNADDIEISLRTSNKIELTNFNLETITKEEFEDFKNSHSIIDKAKLEGCSIDLEYEDGCIVNVNRDTHSYEAAFLSDFLRTQLIRNRKKISCETVMSHSSKLDLLDFSNSCGYKNYLYFICTADPKINIDRVRLRVQQGGHSVNEEKILSRYYRTLGLLSKAVKKTYRTFLWDNSEEEPKLILEVFKGEKVTFYQNTIPSWVNEYLLKR